MVEPGAFIPTSPPRPTLTPALLTLPVAYEFWIWPDWSVLLKEKNPLLPTQPPPPLLASTVTFPVAYESVIVEPAVLEPTRPPAELKLQDPGHALPSPTVTFTLACDCVIVPGCTLF